MECVYNNVCYIVKWENIIDIFVIELLFLLYDIVDSKLIDEILVYD